MRGLLGILSVHGGNDSKREAPERSAVEMRSHDGLRDSLTHLAGPGLFYEELRRELAATNRSGDPLALIRLMLRSAQSESEGGPNISYETEILSFSQTLTRLSRAEDVCSRMGDLEFLALIHGNESVASNFIERITAAWGGDLLAFAGAKYESRVKLVSSRLQALSGESGLDFLNRLDRELCT